MRGLEPPRDCSHSVLSAARLPFRHIRNSSRLSLQAKQTYTSYRSRIVSISFWILDFRFWISFSDLDFRFWIFDFAFLDFGFVTQIEM